MAPVGYMMFALRRKMIEMNLDPEFLDFDFSVHSVEDAARGAGVQVSDMNKNLVLLDDANELAIAVLSGSDRLDLEKVGSLLGSRVRMAKASEVLKLIGFEAGAVPVVDFKGTLVVDTNVAQKPYMFSSAGTSRSLAKISTRKLLEAARPLVADIAVRKAE